MISFPVALALFSSLPFIYAAPPSENPLQKRQLDESLNCGMYASFCLTTKKKLFFVEQWGAVVAGQYTLYINQWGKDNAESGESCAALTSLDGTTIAWTNNWTWTGGDGVKSYTNVNLNEGLGKQLSEIKSIPVRRSYSFAGA